VWGYHGITRFYAPSCTSAGSWYPRGLAGNGPARGALFTWLAVLLELDWFFCAGAKAGMVALKNLAGLAPLPGGEQPEADGQAVVWSGMFRQ
jgi:hypothetical protein